MKDEECQNDILEGVETEAVEDIGGGKVRILTGDARVAKAEASGSDQVRAGGKKVPEFDTSRGVKT